jgi:hypothetical protein
MESQGVAGGIQITEETYQKVKHAYHLTERGTLKIKGKGEMRTYLLTGRIAAN